MTFVRPIHRPSYRPATDLIGTTNQVVVGTTAITGKQVAFQNLGLVVVDEEQRLGVGQKEKLKVRAFFGVLCI